MSSRSEELVKDPEANGFSFTGWAVRLPDGRYIREWRILDPDAGIVPTDRDTEAMTLPTPRSAARLANNVQGDVAEVWESARERLICWGDRTPADRAANPVDREHGLANDDPETPDPTPGIDR
ncbi:hypothetical protein [Paraburkholderia terricola]|uniref:Uncharacterized protein n=1 Tax=Paraburkholderia terricola TaxID=169427 RepID=A0ABU1M1V4_9BURK|nr:hypothetical protein [Paraburkholderia terricola]MDR6412983.1 hypothetical protein [Paraburkholderia terricola]MDR6484821.1 hypothetical protein [Paraburkholderia terricola]